MSLFKLASRSILILITMMCLKFLFPVSHSHMQAAALQSEPEDVTFPKIPTVFHPFSQTMSTLPDVPSQVEAMPRDPKNWQVWPVVPSLTETTRQIYLNGLEMGNNPYAFSKIGDGEISTAWFLTDFDLGLEYYDLGEYSELENIISYFHGSFGRQSIAARRGFNSQRILDPEFADVSFCYSDETPLNCEIRIQRPSFALISLGTNQVWQPDEFEIGLRSIIETLMVHGIVPILSTKADNLEGDHRINSIVADLAVEYDLPVWNFWLAVQPLPDHGLQGDFEHLTYYPNNFSSHDFKKFAWPMRNLSALQTLANLVADIKE